MPSRWKRMSITLADPKSVGHLLHPAPSQGASTLKWVGDDEQAF
jgi:hypothetical protein